MSDRKMVSWRVKYTVTQENMMTIDVPADVPAEEVEDYVFDHVDEYERLFDEVTTVADDFEIIRQVEESQS